MSDHAERACRSCGSLLCQRDDACPTCSRCGARGHLTCTRAAILEGVPQLPAGWPERVAEGGAFVLSGFAASAPPVLVPARGLFSEEFAATRFGWDAPLGAFKVVRVEPTELTFDDPEGGP